MNDDIDMPEPPIDCKVVHDGATEAPGKLPGDFVYVACATGRWVEIHPRPGDTMFYKHSIYARRKDQP